jgi:hypothetical protein
MSNAPALMTLRIVWGSLLASQFLLLVILNLAAPANAEAPDPMMVPMFALVALSSTVASFLVPRLVFRAGLSKLKFDKVEVPDPQAPPGFNKTVTVARDPERAFRQVFPLYTTRTILGCALGESVSLFGFVLKFLGFDWTMAAPFFVVGIAVCALQFPSNQRCLNEAEAALGFPLKAT